MEFSITGHVSVIMEGTEGTQSSKHIATDIRLEVSKELDPRAYLDKNNLPTKNGTKALTSAFVQGLIGNIHQGHQNGYWDSAEHLRYIIKELERGFIEVAHVKQGTFGERQDG